MATIYKAPVQDYVFLLHDVFGPRFPELIGELTADDSAAIELLARRLTNIKQTSGLPSLRMVRALPDGGYAIAQDMGGVFSVRSRVDSGEPGSGVKSASSPMPRRASWRRVACIRVWSK